MHGMFRKSGLLLAACLLCVHDLTTFQDTCYPETRPDQNTTPAWG
jgi:hypothetical protein